jgi:ketosteroid isomerase-like protein
MSQQNVEIVRRWVDAYNRRDIDGLIEISDPDIELQSRFVALESAFRGYDRIRAYFKGLEDAYAHFAVIPTEFIDAGAAVLAVACAEWRGKQSGAEGQTPIVPAFWLRASKVFRTETFTDRGQALEAVGLSEQDAYPAS